MFVYNTNNDMQSFIYMYRLDMLLFIYELDLPDIHCRTKQDYYIIRNIKHLSNRKQIINLKTKGF